MRVRRGEEMSLIRDAATNTTVYFIIAFLVVLSMASIIVPVYFIDWIAEKYSMWYWLLIIPFTWVVIFIMMLITNGTLENDALDMEDAE